MNVFPTFDNYVEQFKLFADSIQPNGTLIWFEGDPELQKIGGNIRKDVKSISYKEHPALIEDKKTFLLNNEKKIPISVFGNHNLQNIQGAKLVCTKLGIDEKTFYKAISTFEGANKRLQKLYFNEEKNITVFLDFAHAPSKVKATIQAVKSIFSKEKMIACLELHTYSSLQKNFLPQYSGSMDACDIPIVYFNPHALALKKLPELSKDEISNGFKNKNINILNDSRQLFNMILSSISKDCVILLMSSGNFDNFDLKMWLKQIQ
jgi:UDP-N-acetylmuramate: L-alanyl-gamma-D-glutamyl-meso-diaminopimelate ligase